MADWGRLALDRAGQKAPHEVALEAEEHYERHKRLHKGTGGQQMFRLAEVACEVGDSLVVGNTSGCHRST